MPCRALGQPVEQAGQRDLSHLSGGPTPHPTCTRDGSAYAIPSAPRARLRELLPMPPQPVDPATPALFVTSHISSGYK